MAERPEFGVILLSFVSPSADAVGVAAALVGAGGMASAINPQGRKYVNPHLIEHKAQQYVSAERQSNTADNLCKTLYFGLNAGYAGHRRACSQNT